MSKIIITEEQLRLLNGQNEDLLQGLHEEYLYEFMKGDPYSDKNLIKKDNVIIFVISGFSSQSKSICSKNDLAA